MGCARSTGRRWATRCETSAGRFPTRRQEQQYSFAVGPRGFGRGEVAAVGNDLQLGAGNSLADRASLRGPAYEVEFAGDDEGRAGDLGTQGPQIDRPVKPRLPGLDRREIEGHPSAQRLQAGD